MIPLAPWVAALASTLLLAAPPQDKQGCKDHPLFNRMPNFDLYYCSVADFDAVDFAKPGLKEWGEKDYETIEGKIFSISYKLKDGVTPVPSALQIIRNFQNAAKAGGGVVMAEIVNPNATGGIAQNMLKFMTESPGGTSYQRFTNLKFVKGDTEYWVNVAASADYQDYNLVIVERKTMAQDIGVNELVDKLNKDGFITLYVNFDTGKSTIKPDSAKTLDEAAAVLKAASTLKILVGGHTDNVGTAEANLKLSEDRAKAVMAALVQRGIVATRLSAQGFGQMNPIADNRTEDGRARNRRVELVKK